MRRSAAGTRSASGGAARCWSCGLLQTASLLCYVAAAFGSAVSAMFWAGTIAEHLLGGMATVALFTLMMDASDPEHAGTDYTLLACAIVVAMGLANFTGATHRRRRWATDPTFVAGFLCLAGGLPRAGAQPRCASRARAAAASGARPETLAAARGISLGSRRRGPHARTQGAGHRHPRFPEAGHPVPGHHSAAARRFDATIDAIEALFTDAEWDGVDAVAGIESRGFILAAALAERRHKGFVPIRKKGKLPPPVVDVAYDLEYGSGVLEMQTGRGRLLLVDDVLATGGTLGASAALARQAGYAVDGIGVLLDLGIVPGFRCDELRAPLGAAVRLMTDERRGPVRADAARRSPSSSSPSSSTCSRSGSSSRCCRASIEDFMGGDTAGAAKVYGVFGTVWALMQFLLDAGRGRALGSLRPPSRDPAVEPRASASTTC